MSTNPGNYQEKKINECNDVSPIQSRLNKDPVEK